MPNRLYAIDLGFFLYVGNGNEAGASSYPRRRGR